MTSRRKIKGGGRPPKFDEPRHPVTMTLPERILDRLAEIDQDRACAVVKVTETVSETVKGHLKPVELIEVMPGKALIVVGPTDGLKKIPWVKLVEIAPNRYILTVPSGTPVEALEVALRDLYDNPETKKSTFDRTILNELLELISYQRRAQRLSKAEILVIDTN
jgi:hypothetical protein